MASPQPGPAKLMMQMGILYLAGKIEYTEETVAMLRGSYMVVILSIIGALFIIYQKIEAAKDTKKIFVKPPAVPFAPPDEAVTRTETTYYHHEMQQLKALAQQTVIGACISGGIHYKMEINHVLAMQIVMQPVNLIDNKLLKKHLLGTATNADRVWEETYEGEAEEGPVNGASLDKLIAETWESGDEINLDPLAKAIEGNVDHQTEKDGWTALMIACGSPKRCSSAVKRLLELGARTDVQDKEGWTAIHWAAFHGRAHAATLVLASSSDPEKLLSIKALDGRTALEVAREEVAQGQTDNKKVAEILSAAASSGVNEEEEDEDDNEPTAPAADPVVEGSMHDID